MDVTANEGILYHVKDISVDQNNETITITFLFENFSKEYIGLYDYKVLIDNVYSGYSFAGEPSLAPGCKTINSIKIPNRMDKYDFLLLPYEIASDLQFPRRFDWPVIDQISCIDLYNGMNTFGKLPKVVHLELQKPIKYQFNHTERVDDSNILPIGNELVSLTVQRAYRSKSNLIMEVLIENKSFEETTLDFSLSYNQPPLSENAGVYLEQRLKNRFQIAGKGLCRGLVIIPLSEDEWQKETIEIKLQGNPYLKEELFDIGTWTIPVKDILDSQKNT